MIILGILQFVNRTPGSGQTGTVISPLPLSGVLKYSLKRDLPKAESRGVMIFTTDTRELYQGNGIGLALTRITDVMLYDNVESFPETGVEEKFFISKSDKNIYFWDGEKYVRANEETASGQFPSIDEFDKMVSSTIFPNYRQRVHIENGILTSVQLDFVPASGTIGLSVNGVSYFEPAFVFDELNNKVHWLFNKSNGGFDITPEFSVFVQYDIVYGMNGITDVHRFVEEQRKYGTMG